MTSSVIEQGPFLVGTGEWRFNSGKRQVSWQISRRGRSGVLCDSWSPKSPANYITITEIKVKYYFLPNLSKHNQPIKKKKKR